MLTKSSKVEYVLYCKAPRWNNDIYFLARPDEFSSLTFYRGRDYSKYNKFRFQSYKELEDYYERILTYKLHSHHSTDIYFYKKIINSAEQTEEYYFANQTK